MLAEGGGDELDDDRGDPDPRRAPASFRRLRSSTSGFTSSSSTEVSWAEVWRLVDHPRGDRPAAAAQRDRARDGQPARLARGERGAGSRAAAHAVTSRSRMRPPGPGAGDLARVVEREAELLQQRPRARRDERRTGPTAGAGGAGAARRGRGARRLRDGRASAVPDVAEERVAVRPRRRPPCAVAAAASAAYSSRVSAISATVVPIGTVCPAGTR